MKQNKNITNDSNPSEKAEAQVMTQSHMSQDLRNAVLIVSVIANLFILTGWIALQVTTQYDTQIANLLFNR